MARYQLLMVRLMKIFNGLKTIIIYRSSEFCDSTMITIINNNDGGDGGDSDDDDDGLKKKLR